MPAAGFVHFVTAGVSTITTGASTFTLLVTNPAGVSSLVPAAAITLTAPTATATKDLRASPVGFNAGDRLCWQCTAASPDGITYNVATWYTFA